MNQVRNSWLTHGSASTFMDAADWEKVKRKGVAAVRKWINQQLAGTSVTVVLIGKETANRKHVLYEIQRSVDLGKGMLGVYIHDVKNKEGEVELWGGANPFDKFELKRTSLFDYIVPPTLADSVKVYDWVSDNGYLNMPAWIEEAAIRAKR